MATTYTELLSEVADWLERADLTARIPTFIQLAEAQMNRALRVQRMIQRATDSITTADEFKALPSNFLEAISYKISDGTNVWDLEPTTIDQISDAQSCSTAADVPRFYTINGTSTGREFQHYPAPKQTYATTLTYFGKPDPLSGSVATNWILAEAPDAYLYGALLQAAPYLRDTEAAQIWNAGYTAALDSLKTMDRTRVGKLRSEVSRIGSRRFGYNVNTDF